MTERPDLIVHAPPGPVRGVALVLHGGRTRSRRPVHATNLAVLRMLPFVRALRHADDSLAVAQVRYRVRGWNGADRSPVPDTEWALDRLVERFPDLPVALVGHSMGGRVAAYVGGHRAVRAVVGLAPWIEDGDPVHTLAGRRVLIAHGNRDRTTDPRASATYARSAEGIAESVSFVTVRGESHAMVRRPRVWDDLVTGFVTGALPGGDAVPSETIRQALAGTASLTV